MMDDETAQHYRRVIQEARAREDENRRQRIEELASTDEKG